MRCSDCRHASVHPNHPGRSGCGYDWCPVCHNRVLPQFAFISTSRGAIRDNFRYRWIGWTCDALRGQCGWQSVAGCLLNRAVGMDHTAGLSDTGIDSLEYWGMVLAEDYGIQEMKHDARHQAPGWPDARRKNQVFVL